MEQYIPKFALVAEIKRLKDRAHELYGCSQFDTAYDNVLSILDTFEVKDVDLDFMLHEYWNLSSKITIDCLESATMTKDEMINFAKHFFELGLKAQEGE